MPEKRLRDGKQVSYNYKTYCEKTDRVSCFTIVCSGDIFVIRPRATKPASLLRHRVVTKSLKTFASMQK